jgi:hypothetical protein
MEGELELAGGSGEWLEWQEEGGRRYGPYMDAGL